MSKFNLGVMILTAICIVGTIILLAIGRDVSVLLPITTTFVGFIVGMKRDSIVSAFRKDK